MPAYLLAIIKVKDKERFVEYANLAKAFPSKYGGQYLAFGRPAEVIEGEAPNETIVISKWPSAQAVKDMWFSDDYAEVRKIREGAADVSAMIFEGAD